MTPTQADDLIFILSRIAIALEGSAAKTAPDIIMDIAQYPNFDWASIGAEVADSDADGATAVLHNGKVYTRRTHAKFGNDIWYSRATGKDDDDKNIYEKLVSFKEMKIEAEPLPRKTAELLKTFKRPSPTTSGNSKPEHQVRLQAVRQLTGHTAEQVGAIASNLLQRNLKEKPPSSNETGLIRDALLADWASKHDVDEAMAAGILYAALPGESDLEVCDRFMELVAKQPVAS